MKRKIIYVILSAVMAGSALGAVDVTVIVDASQIKGDISPMLTGMNMSWYYDTDDIWSDGSMVCYLRRSGSKILRYPGGCETSKYHWEYPYGGASPCGDWALDYYNPDTDPNDHPYDNKFMDTDDYIKVCRQAKTEPMIGVNIQSGIKYNRLTASVDEAVRWVQYCKDKNYNVKYWYLENEPYYHSNCDEITAADYAGYIQLFASAMKAVDPDIKIIINWENKLSVQSYWDDWEIIIDRAGSYIDIADVHWYWAWGYATWDMWLFENPMLVREWCGDCPDQKYIGPSYVDDIKGFYNKIKDVNGISYDIKLASLEWNIAPVKDGRFSRFQHALMQSEMLAQFIEGGVHMACIWPLHWGGGLFGDFNTIVDQTNHKPTPSFLVFQLYSEILGQKLVTSQASISNVRSVSAVSQDGKTVWLYLLNKSATGSKLTAEVSLNGFTAVKAEGKSITAPQLSSNIAGLNKLNDLINNSGSNQWQVPLSPYSLTMLKFSSQ